MTENEYRLAIGVALIHLHELYATFGDNSLNDEKRITAARDVLCRALASKPVAINTELRAIENTCVIAVHVLCVGLIIFVALFL